MNPVKFVERDSFWVMGLQVHGVPESLDYPTLWDTYFAGTAQVEPYACGPRSFGVYFPSERPEEPQIDVIAGREVREGSQAPEGWVVRQVSGGHFAVFEVAMDGIADFWKSVMSQWQPEPEWQAVHTRPCFEEFSPAVSEGGEPVRIYLPVEPKVDCAS